jgi:glucosamine--fructose-6-phosphate aminotransferase (isomerizing)
MCGIFGCLRNSDAKLDIANLIVRALNLLKNRGYDSCGIYLNSLINDQYMKKFGIDGEIIKESKLNLNIDDIFVLLENEVNKIEEPASYYVGMGHTRWATHGAKTDYNSHPHKSNNNKITLVHNGIISNCDELKHKYLSKYTFYSNTDTEVIANLIQYLQDENGPDANGPDENGPDTNGPDANGTDVNEQVESPKTNTNTNTKSFDQILEQITLLLEGTWACIIQNESEPTKLYFMKNENPLLIGFNDEIMMLTSEPSGFMNMVDSYILLREKTYGWFDNSSSLSNSSGLSNSSNKFNYKIYGNYKELPLLKSSSDDITLSKNFDYWMRKEIQDQTRLSVLIDPITQILRYNQSNVLFNLDFIKPCKYLYIIACGSSYYAGLIASNYFRYTKAFEFVNVFDGGEFTRAHLEAINNPEKDLLIILISQSGETRDLNIATTICREYSSNRINKLIPNSLIANSDPINQLFDNNYKKVSKNSNIQVSDQINEKPNHSEIKIIGIINVIGSLISRRTIDNIYTNCGRENAVASTKSCTSQILACLLLSIYKAELTNNLDIIIKNKFLSDLNRLETDIITTIELESKIKSMANTLLTKNIKSLFILGKDELHGSALEGALKIKEIAYIHAEGFHIAALKHGPYAMIEKDTPIILLYKQRDHFVKSIIEETKTRGAYVIEISPNAFDNEDSIVLPNNKTFTGLIAVITLQLLAYHLSLAKSINPDRPRNLAKVVTVD